MFNQIKTTSYLLAAIILSLAFFPAHAQEEISNEDFKKLIAIQKSKISNMELLTQQQAKLITDLSGKLDAVTKVATQLEKQVANAQKSAYAAQETADGINRRIIPICHFDSPSAGPVGGRQWTHPCTDNSLVTVHGYRKEGPYFYGISR